jgi:hypothetical protein
MEEEKGATIRIGCDQAPGAVERNAIAAVAVISALPWASVVANGAFR